MDGRAGQGRGLRAKGEDTPSVAGAGRACDPGLNSFDLPCHGTAAGLTSCWASCNIGMMEALHFQQGTPAAPLSHKKQVLDTLAT